MVFYELHTELKEKILSKLFETKNDIISDFRIQYYKNYNKIIARK